MLSSALLRWTTVATCVSCCATAAADGKLFVWRNEAIDIHQPEQKAVIYWEGSTERLILQSKFAGPPEDMVWIIPVPAEPQVNEASIVIFEKLSQKTQDLDLIHTWFPDPYQTMGIEEPDPLQWERRIGAFEVALLNPAGNDNVVTWLRAHENSIS